MYIVYKDEVLQVRKTTATPTISVLLFDLIQTLYTAFTQNMYNFLLTLTHFPGCFSHINLTLMACSCIPSFISG